MKSVTIGAVLLTVCICFSATGVSADEASAKCVQSGLNALGYAAGTVNGQIGNGTQAAFARFRSETQGAPNFTLNETTMMEWCLYIANREGIDDATRAIAAPIETAAEVRVVMEIDSLALAGVGLLRENELIAQSTAFETRVEGAGTIQTAAFPYVDVRRADRICVKVGDDYRVLTNEGRPAQGVCHREPIAFWLGDRMVQYKTVRADTL